MGDAQLDYVELVCTYIHFKPLKYLIVNLFCGIPSLLALLVASRIHNFNRSVKEVARVVKLSEGTIRKR